MVLVNSTVLGASWQFAREVVMLVSVSGIWKFPHTLLQSFTNTNSTSKGFRLGAPKGIKPETVSIAKNEFVIAVSIDVASTKSSPCATDILRVCFGIKVPVECLQPPF